MFPEEVTHVDQSSNTIPMTTPFVQPMTLVDQIQLIVQENTFHTRVIDATTLRVYFLSKMEELKKKLSSPSYL